MFMYSDLFGSWDCNEEKTATFKPEQQILIFLNKNSFSHVLGGGDIW